MIFSKAFFELQLRYAEKASQICTLPLIEALARYTNFYRVFVKDELFDWTHPVWKDYVVGLDHAATVTQAVVDWTYHSYQLSLEEQHSAPLRWWGCFYFTYHQDDREVVRIHFGNRDDSGYRAFSSHQQPTRLRELTDMFREIKASIPEARILRGESWLYNRKEYRRLFPAVYTAAPLVIPGGFQYQALWGQFLRSDGSLQSESSSAFLQRIAVQQDTQSLQSCFPFSILRVECKITEFYAFYDL